MEEITKKLKRFYSANIGKPQDFPLTLPPPAMVEQIEWAEEKLGFKLPVLLRELYLEISNGGWGPGIGCLEIRAWASLVYSLEEAVEIYLEIKEICEKNNCVDLWEQEQKGLFPLADAGCCQMYMLDCTIENGPVYLLGVMYNLGEMLSLSFEQYLEDWLNDPGQQSIFDIPYQNLNPEESFHA